MKLCKLVLWSTVVCCGAAVAADATSDYPSRPVRQLVPNAPGSAVDTLGRIVGQKLPDVLGQQVVIDNRPGAAGVIAMEIAKMSAPDGYTLITATTAATTVARLMVKNPPYHPLKDYDYVVQFAETPNVLIVNPKVPAKSVKELIEYAKSNKTGFNMASAGAGSQSHLSGAYFQQAAHIDSLHVPYKGGGPSVASIVSGESQWTLTPAPAVMSHISAGRVRAIGHSLPKPSPLLPNIPPIAEAVRGFDYSGWMGFFLPKGTPRAINVKLREAVVKTMENPDVKKQFVFQATEIVIRGPEEFRKVVAESMAQNEKLVKSLGLAAN